MTCFHKFREEAAAQGLLMQLVVFIQPLGDGDFDIKALLQTLDELQFRGPIGLQCYGIKTPPSGPLPQSMQAWQQAMRR